MEKFDEGDWVAALWGDIWWVGVVKDQLEMDDYSVKFMHPLDGSRVEQCKIDWPDVEDITAIPHGDILCLVSEPTRALFKQKWCYTLPDKEVKDIQERFDKIS